MFYLHVYSPVNREHFRHPEELPELNREGRNIINIGYADETVLLAESSQNIQKLLDKINNVSQE